MSSEAYPFAIPLLQSALAKRPIDEFGNTPTPIGLLEMPMQWVSWLLYNAKRWQEVVEWTPLTTGPGTRVDYTGQDGWDGTKFTIPSSVLLIGNTTDVAPFTWGAQYATPQAARDGVRGYNALTNENPSSPSWSYPAKPGAWIGSGPWVDTDRDNTMLYRGDTNWPSIKIIVSTKVTAALSAWLTRLNNWLAAEQAKVPQNAALIADIQRQITVQTALAAQISSALELTFTKLDEYRQMLIDGGETEAFANRFATLSAYEEHDSYQRWISAEEIMEAFSAKTMPLNLFRRDFVEWVQFLISGKYFGWTQPGLISVKGLAIGAGLTTQALGTMTSGAIPALSTARIGVQLAYPQSVETDLNPPWTYNSNLATIFTKQIVELSTDGITELTTDQITAIGPIAIGFSAAECEIPPRSTLPMYGTGITSDPVTTQDLSILTGEEVGVFRMQRMLEISTSEIQAIPIYECPLFASVGRVGALNITWRIFDTDA